MVAPVRSQWQQLLLAIFVLSNAVNVVESKLADRSRIVKARQEAGHIGRYHDNGRPIEGHGYRSQRRNDQYDASQRAKQNAMEKRRKLAQPKLAPWQMEDFDGGAGHVDVPMSGETPKEFQRRLSSQLSGCCYTYEGYSAQDLCSMYGNDCESGETPSHDSSDEDCSADGLSFIGVSFSVNTANGNPYSYQLCDQFPMENIIDRDYEFIMSMDEDGWLVGGGYKTFDYSGKMP